jgi:hypothetical protein
MLNDPLRAHLIGCARPLGTVPHIRGYRALCGASRLGNVADRRLDTFRTRCTLVYCVALQSPKLSERPGWVLNLSSNSLGTAVPSEP